MVLPCSPHRNPVLLLPSAQVQSSGTNPGGENGTGAAEVGEEPTAIS
jgi:hypothetical protein